MLLQAAREWSIDLARSVMVGDALTDVQAGLAAGARPILVRTGRGESEAARLISFGLTEVTVVPDLAAALKRVGAAAG